MKKRFQLLLILLLTYAFICCPAFVGSSFAEGRGNNRAVQNFFQEAISSMVSTVQFIVDSTPTWVQEMKFPTSMDDIKANREKRKEIRQQIKEKMGLPWFNRPNPASTD